MKYRLLKKAEDPTNTGNDSYSVSTEVEVTSGCFQDVRALQSFTSFKTEMCLISYCGRYFGYIHKIEVIIFTCYV